MTVGRKLSKEARELLDGLVRAPEDTERYLVLADALSAVGDPQGELIVLMHRVRESAHWGSALDAHLTKYKTKYFGPSLSKHRGISWDLELGFVRSIRYMPDVSDRVDDVLRQIFELPIAELLRNIVVFADSWDEEGIAALSKGPKPPLVDQITLATKHQSIESALADGKDGANATWLDLRLGRQDLPADLTKLSHLEWLGIGGSLLTALPRELTRLQRLRRLDIDFLFSLRVMPDEIFGIETLSYISMYDCGLRSDQYHMGRINNLLGGFSRAKTPSSRRVFEAAMMLGGLSRASKFVKGDALDEYLLAALDNNVAQVREAAMEALNSRLPNAIENTSVDGMRFALVGSTNFDRKELVKRLGDAGAKVTTKIDASTTHVIVGSLPGEKIAGLGGRPIVLERHLVSLLNGEKASGAKSKKRPSAQAKAANTVANTVDVGEIKRGLASRDESTVAGALTALHSSGVPPELLAALVVVAQDVTLKRSRDVAKKLLAVHAPPSVIKAMNERLKSSLLASQGETKRSDRIAAFCRAAKVIDPIELAELLVMRARVGLKYLVENAPAARVVDVLRRMTTAERTLDLRHLNLAKVPKEVAELDDVVELVLTGNGLDGWPEPVLAMKSLRHLDLSHNWVKRVPEAAAKLKVVELRMDQCRLDAFPRAVFEMKLLERLSLANDTQWDRAPRTGLPPEIGRLTNLRALHYDFHHLDTIPNGLFDLELLDELSLVQCDVPKEIPAGFSKLKNLQKLDVSLTDWASKKNELASLLPKGCEITARRLS